MTITMELVTLSSFDGCYGTDPFDHDNDGISDEDDWDDDNDGILEVQLITPKEPIHGMLVQTIC